MSDTVLVIGGGIAGVQAALDLADAGARVVLVEASPAIGGKMAALDKNFPTLDCSICIEAPKLSEIAEHPNIEVLAPAELIAFEGQPGDFTARIRVRSRFVTDECTRCNLCVDACPVVLPNEFDVAMASRKAIYTPFPQAVPGAYIIDIDHCLNDPPNYLPCGRCMDACAPRVIDFTQPRERVVERRVGAAIVATGFELIDPGLLRAFGYGKHPDVLTSLEFERMLTSAGPTGGDIVKPSNGEHPERMLFVLCVGSRDVRFYRYCSRFCCMYSVKEAFQARDHGVPDVSVLYMDLRAYGKGFDAFVDRTREHGVRFIRGRPASVEPAGERILVRYENTDEGRVETSEVDMVVLATAARPPEGLERLAGLLGIALAEDGFVAAREEAGGLIVTSRPGIYAAGCATGLKDIPDSVSEAAGAAAAALTHIDERHWPEFEMVDPQDDLDTARIGVNVCHCGSNIAGVVDIAAVVEAASRMEGVVYAGSSMFSCAGTTQAEIARRLREARANRVVIAACSPKTHEATFRRVMLKAGLNPYLLEMANIRNQDSWVHKQSREEATAKAIDMVRMAVEKARRLAPLTATHQPVVQKALIIGGGVAGMTAAANLAKQGYETHLVERSSRLGGVLNDLERIEPSGLEAAEVVRRASEEVAAAGVKVHLGADIETIGGHVGNFSARLSTGEEVQAGAVILAMGARPYRPTEFGYGLWPNVLTNLELAAGKPVMGDRVTFIACVGARRGALGCSRYCCESMIGEALRLQMAGKKVRVVYRDIRSFSRDAEELYARAAAAGVQFFRMDPQACPEEVVDWDGHAVQFFDYLTGRTVRIPTDTLVLTVGLLPQEETVSAQLKVARSEDGFLLERHPKLGPAEAGSPGIYLAGTVQAPKDVRESVSQALAAAAKASAVLARGTILKEPITARLLPDRCIVCGICAAACPFGAIELIGKPKEGEMRFIEAACQGCGACAATCNYDAIEMPYFTKEQILAQIDAALAHDPQHKTLVFACNWCSYAGADQAGVEKIQYPPSALIIRTMCSARVEEDFITRAFERGAGAVLVTGCRLTEKGSDCHYNYANVQTKKRFEMWHRKLTRQGLDPDRLQLAWISASEGKEFARKIAEMDAVIRRQGGGVLERVSP
ncbi:MAG TPA: hydrogenase iron-sulfur subunit [Dehalococcoidia bacterium]|nr:hydrogenase iron-sulfur subunit [Dehalococcoidia bacterium]